MKNLTNRSSKSGFTLMELMVAMAITTIIVTVLVSITSIAIDVWNRSRAELRAARQAKSMVDTMARDFEAMVTRRGNEFEWLSAVSPAGGLPGDKLKSSNAAELIFFSGSTDRYNGNIGDPNDDKGGDVSAVAYSLDYRDPITVGGVSDFKTFVLNRLLVNPDDTFKELLGQKDLVAVFGSRKQDLTNPENFVCENVYQFTVKFHVETTTTTGTPGTTVIKNTTIPIGTSGASTFSIKGTGMDATGTMNMTAEELKGARLRAVEISLTVISDAGIDQLQRRTFNSSQESEFLMRNSFQYSKVVQVPGM
jgi:prepilin-type N-terminal cleavage/methylation domain-containing protein